MSDTIKIAAVVLAAGQSRRSGAVNKLLHPINAGRLGSCPDRSMICCVVDMLLSTPISSIIVVTGFEAAKIQSVLPGVSVDFVHNHDFSSGMGRSIGCGVSALPNDVDGVLICLGDMPHVKSKTIKALLEAMSADCICVPVCEGKRGNPVLFSRRFFPALKEIHGDRGGKAVVQNNPQFVQEVDVDDRGIFIDHDQVGQAGL